MAERWRATLFYFWRVLATACCFAVFGLAGIVLGFVYFPLLNLFIWQRQRRIGLARTTIQTSFRLFIGLMQLLRVLRYEVIGQERLERSGLLILANHPSLIDTVFLMALTGNAVGVLKAQLQKNFFMRGVVRAAGYIFNDQGTALIDAGISALQAGSNLIMFPEGTRSPVDGAIHLKRGAATIALRAQHNITPVIIHCQPRMLGKTDHWWRVPSRAAKFRIEVMDDIDVTRFSDELGSGLPLAVAARHLTVFLQNYFIEEVQRHVRI